MIGMTFLREYDTSPWLKMQALASDLHSSSFNSGYPGNLSTMFWHKVCSLDSRKNQIWSHVQWLPIQMRAFHSNKNGLFFLHPLSVAPLFLVEGKGQAGSSHLNEKLSFE